MKVIYTSTIKLIRPNQEHIGPNAKSLDTTNQGTNRQARGTEKKGCHKPATSILKNNTTTPNPNGKSGQGTPRVKTPDSSWVGRTDNTKE